MEVHFWVATIGIVIYIAAMWIAGVMQGLDVARYQCRRYADLHLCRVRQGDLSRSTCLRLLGGVLYLSGMIIMLWNVLKTATAGRAVSVNVTAAAAHA
jgi:cytochrome c oxidase cbb3-type subunit 1